MERVGTTDTFVGTLVFATEAADQTLVTQTAAGFDAVLNTTDRQKVGQIFTVVTSEAWVVRKSRIYLTKTGVPTGNIFISIVRDAAVPGTPSLVLTDILSETNAILVSGLSTGLNVLSLPDTVLPAGVYHIVVRTDDTYKTQYTSSGGTSNIAIQVDAVATGVEKFDGTVWTASAGADFKQNITGRKLDLRVKITASTTSQLVGTGILYDLQTNGIVGGIKNRQVFAFNSTTNPNSFVLTQFRPDPDLLGVYFIQTGQVFRAPKFYLNGNTVVFPANTFNNGGVPADLTLVFDQSNGTSFDNSDMNALLLAGNFLGSTDPSIDRSANGRGIFLRRPDGTLRELTIDNNDSIVIYSV
jgi:hypothetical protein